MAVPATCPPELLTQTGVRVPIWQVPPAVPAPLIWKSEKAQALAETGTRARTSTTSIGFIQRGIMGLSFICEVRRSLRSYERRRSRQSRKSPNWPRILTAPPREQGQKGYPPSTPAKGLGAGRRGPDAPT